MYLAIYDDSKASAADKVRAALAMFQDRYSMPATVVLVSKADWCRDRVRLSIRDALLKTGLIEKSSFGDYFLDYTLTEAGRQWLTDSPNSAEV